MAPRRRGWNPVFRPITRPAKDSGAGHEAVLFPPKAIRSRSSVGSRASFEAMHRAIAFHKIRPAIDHIAPFEETDRAMRDFKAEKHFGKIVLSIA